MSKKSNKTLLVRNVVLMYGPSHTCKGLNFSPVHPGESPGPTYNPCVWDPFGPFYRLGIAMIAKEKADRLNKAEPYLSCVFAFDIGFDSAEINTGAVYSSRRRFSVTAIKAGLTDYFTLSSPEFQVGSITERLLAPTRYTTDTERWGQGRVFQPYPFKGESRYFKSRLLPPFNQVIIPFKDAMSMPIYNLSPFIGMNYQGGRGMYALCSWYLFNDGESSRPITMATPWHDLSIDLKFIWKTRHRIKKKYDGKGMSLYELLSSIHSALTKLITLIYSSTKHFRYSTHGSAVFKTLRYLSLSARTPVKPWTSRDIFTVFGEEAERNRSAVPPVTLPLYPIGISREELKPGTPIPALYSLAWLPWKQVNFDEDRPLGRERVIRTQGNDQTDAETVHVQDGEAAETAEMIRDYTEMYRARCEALRNKLSHSSAPSTVAYLAHNLGKMLYGVVKPEVNSIAALIHLNLYAQRLLMDDTKYGRMSDMISGESPIGYSDYMGDDPANFMIDRVPKEDNSALTLPLRIAHEKFWTGLGTPGFNTVNHRGYALTINTSKLRYGEDPTSEQVRQWQYGDMTRTVHVSTSSSWLNPPILVASYLIGLFASLRKAIRRQQYIIKTLYSDSTLKSHPVTRLLVTELLNPAYNVFTNVYNAPSGINNYNELLFPVWFIENVVERESDFVRALSKRGKLGEFHALYSELEYLLSLLKQYAIVNRKAFVVGGYGEAAVSDDDIYEFYMLTRGHKLEATIDKIMGKYYRPEYAYK